MKRHAALQDLSRDHQHALLHARHIRWMAESHPRARAFADVRAEALTFWQDDYRLHLEEEETLLVPALHGAGLSALAAAMLADHQRLRAQVEQVKASEHQAPLIEFGQQLHAHVRLEERVIFEQLQQALAEPELAALGAQSQRFRERHQRPRGPFYRTCTVQPTRNRTHG